MLLAKKNFEFHARVSSTMWTEESADYVPASQSQSNYNSHPSQMLLSPDNVFDLRYVKNLARIPRRNKTSMNIIKLRFQPFHSKTRAWSTRQV